MLDKLIERFNQRYGISTICTNLIKSKYSRKKLSKIARRQNDYVRLIWRQNVQEIDSSRFFFLDETRKDPKTLRRCWGRGRRGERVKVHAEFTRATRGFSALAVMIMDGIVALSITSAPGVNAGGFKADIEMLLVPLLRSDSVVVMDNGNILLVMRVKIIITLSTAFDSRALLSVSC